MMACQKRDENTENEFPTENSMHSKFRLNPTEREETNEEETNIRYNLARKNGRMEDGIFMYEYKKGNWTENSK